MSRTDLETGATVAVPSNRKPRYWRNPMTIVLIVAIALLFIALLVARSNNAELQKILNERDEEVKALTDKCVTRVRETLEGLDEDQPEPTEEPKIQPAPGAGTDNGTNVTERW